MKRSGDKAAKAAPVQLSEKDLGEVVGGRGSATYNPYVTVDYVEDSPTAVQKTTDSGVSDIAAGAGGASA